MAMARFERSMVPIMGELFGTFALVFLTGLIKVHGDPLLAPATVAVGFSSLLYALMPVGAADGGAYPGVHLNPAITVSLGISGRAAGLWPRALWAIIAQMVGGFLGGCAYGAILKEDAVLVPDTGYGLWQCGFVEAFFTAMLCFVFLSCLECARMNDGSDGYQIVSLAAGLVYVAGGYSAVAMSGAYFNPALVFGIGFTAYKPQVTRTFAFILFQLLGASAASICFRFCRRDCMQQPAEPGSIRRPAKLGARMGCEFLGALAVVVSYGLSATAAGIASPSDATSPANLLQHLNTTTSTTTSLVTSAAAAAPIGAAESAPWAAGAALAALTYSIGSVSGGHCNPAVSLAIVLCGRGKCRPLDGLMYAVAQLCGGLLGGHCVGRVLASEAASRSGAAAAAVAHGQGFTFFQANILEFFFTVVLCFIVLSVATTSARSHSFSYGIAIGGAATAGSFAIFKVSGGYLNPALSLGAGLSTYVAVGAGLYKNTIFAMWQIFASIVAAFLFTITHPDEYPIKDDDW